MEINTFGDPTTGTGPRWSCHDGSQVYSKSVQKNSTNILSLFILLSLALSMSACDPEKSSSGDQEMDVNVDRGLSMGGESTAGESIAGRALPVRALPVRALPVRALPVRALPVRALPVRALPVRALPVRALPVRAQAV